MQKVEAASDREESQLSETKFSPPQNDSKLALSGNEAQLPAK